MLLCPMLTVSDEVKPPWVVQMIFKHVLARLFPTWPVTPSKGDGRNRLKRLAQKSPIMTSESLPRATSPSDDLFQES